MTVDRYGIHIGTFIIYFYGLIIMSGVVVSAYLSAWRAKDYDQNGERVWDILVWALIGGVIGARLWHILTPPPSMVEQGYTAWYYLTHPLDMLNIRAGGLGIPGAVIGGALGLLIYCRRNAQSFAVWADIAAPGLILAQAIGRWGNFVNQELYGMPSSLPWAITIDPAHRLPEFMQYSTYHPLFLYESLWNLGICLLLMYLALALKKWLRPGDLFLFYLVGYPVGRFFLEFLRLDSAQVGGLNINQTIMGVIALTSIALLVWRHRSGAPAEPAVEDEDGEEQSAQPEPIEEVPPLEEKS